MYELVADIEKYPQFVPLCTRLEIRSRRKKAGREIIIADMEAGYKSVRESFTCQVVLDPDADKIDVSYLDGPFRYLENRWRFQNVDDVDEQPCCDVGFFIDYEFKSRILGALMGSMFDTAFKRFTDAFEARADALYTN